MGDIEHFFQDLPPNPKFGNIGRLGANGGEFKIYKELGALPKAYR